MSVNVKELINQAEAELNTSGIFKRVVGSHK